MTGVQTCALPISNKDTTKTAIVAGSVAKATVTDKDGKAISGLTCTYQWYQDSYSTAKGAVNVKCAGTGNATAEYTVAGTDAGHKLVCVATATAGADGTLVSDATATITDTLASVNIGTTATVGAELTATLASTNTATAKDITATYQWYRGVTPISGATSAKYVVTSDDFGQAVTCQAVGTGSFSGTKLSNALSVGQGTYTASIKVNGDTALSANGSAALGDTLTAGTTPTTIPSGDVSYQWYQSSNETTGYTAITGATSATYAPTTVGNWYECVITTVTGKTTYYTTASATTKAVNLGKKITSVSLAEASGTYTPTLDPTTATAGYTWYLDNTAAENQLGTKTGTFAAEVGTTYTPNTLTAYIAGATGAGTAVTSFVEIGRASCRERV